MNEDSGNLNSYVFADDEHVRRERAKVREAKRSRWWQQKTARGLCSYCGKKFTFKELTLDHIVPLSRGGTTSPGNVVPACRMCNKGKGIDTPLDMLLSPPAPSEDT
ncbi:MAG: HNH endonuclease [Silvanigrellales bacterium]|jgi:5-methylcytosine-specific restriction protein A|nr:HNH endonuclease [Silvanigrellales bacterium]